MTQSIYNENLFESICDIILLCRFFLNFAQSARYAGWKFIVCLSTVLLGLYTITRYYSLFNS